jgi:hypothetical protein
VAHDKLDPRRVEKKLTEEGRFQQWRRHFGG